MPDFQFESYRILDAAANRVREGLRVVEDYARFGLNDEHLSRILKTCRHDLAAIISHLPENALLTSRDTVNDVGTTITTPSEYHRSSAIDVIRAAFKRTQEALRTLEEYSKVIDASLSPRFEQLRYRLYTAEKIVLRTNQSIEQLHQQHVYLLVQEEVCTNGLESVVKSALDAGVRLFQLREKSLGDRRLIEQARRVRAWTRAANAILIINDRPDIAVLADADGVHVGQKELSVQDARKIVGADRFVGVSTHSIEQARQAVLDGADYLGVGPTFPSQTKSFENFPGLRLISEVAKEIRLPWFAIGGIDQSNAGQVLDAGTSRVAVSSVICRSDSPEIAARTLLETFSQNARQTP